jgi:hypothetical protein
MPLVVTQLHNEEVLGAVSGVPVIMNIGTVTGGIGTLLLVTTRIGNTSAPIDTVGAGSFVLTDSVGNDYGGNVVQGDGFSLAAVDGLLDTPPFATTWLVYSQDIIGASPLSLTFTISGLAITTFDLQVSICILSGLVATPVNAFEDFSAIYYSSAGGTSFTSGNVSASINNSVLLSSCLSGRDGDVAISIADTSTLISSHYGLSLAFRLVDIGTFSSSWSSSPTTSEVNVMGIILPISGAAPPVVVFKPIVYIT